MTFSSLSRTRKGTKGNPSPSCKSRESSPTRREHLRAESEGREEEGAQQLRFMDHQTPRQQGRSIQSPPRFGASIHGGRGEGSACRAADTFTAVASAQTDAAAAAVGSTAAAGPSAAAAVSTAAAPAATDPAMAATARADANVDVTASAPAASALLTGAAAVGIAATTPTDAATTAPDVAATSAGDRDPIQDLYSAAFTLRELSRSQ